MQHLPETRLPRQRFDSVQIWQTVHVAMQPVASQLAKQPSECLSPTSVSVRGTIFSYKVIFLFVCCVLSIKILYWPLLLRCELPLSIGPSQNDSSLQDSKRVESFSHRSNVFPFSPFYSLIFLVSSHAFLCFFLFLVLHLLAHKVVLTASKKKGPNPFDITLLRPRAVLFLKANSTIPKWTTHSLKMHLLSMHGAPVCWASCEFQVKAIAFKRGQVYALRLISFFRSTESRSPIFC